MAWYDTGTVSVTNGSTAVVGSGTDFISAKVQVGEAFYGPDGKIYEIAAIVSSTSLTLADNYLGTTQSGQTYKIVPTQSLVADLATNVSTLITDFANVRDLAGEGKFDDGTAAAPGITFNLDQDNGLYRIGANNWAMAVGGSKIVDLTSTGFSVTGNVGIGTASPNSPLDVRGGNVYVDGGGISGASQVILATSASSGSNFGQISNTGTRWSLGYGAAIGTVGTEVLTWNSSGNVGIGVSPSYPLHVQIPSDGSVGAAFRYLGGTNNPGLFFSTNESTSVSTIDASGSITGTLAFSTGGTERMRIDSSGNVGIGVAPATDWNSAYHALQVGTTATFMGAASGSGEGNWISNNAIFSSSGNWEYIQTASASSLDMQSSTAPFRFRYAASGTAGAAITWSEAMRIDSSGNVGINTTDIGANLSVRGDASTGVINVLDVGNNQNAATTGDGARIRLHCTSDENRGVAIGSYSETNYAVDNSMLFYTSASSTLSEKMRIDSSGNLLVGNPTPIAKLSVNGQGAFGSEDASGNGIYLYVSGALSDNSYMSRSSAGTGTTTWYIGNQSITTSSDLRLKDNIVDSQRNAVEIINNLRVVDHTWNDPSDQSINNKNSRGVWTGLIAQEAVEHIPWLVNRPLEDVDENGNKNYWHMDYGYSVPLLIKAIQEQQDLIESLTARIAALEGAN